MCVYLLLSEIYQIWLLSLRISQDANQAVDLLFFCGGAGYPGKMEDYFDEFEFDVEASTHSEIIKAQYYRILENSLPQFLLYTQNDMIMGRNWRWNISSTPNFIFVNMWMNLS